MMRFDPHSLTEYHSIKKRIVHKQLHVDMQLAMFNNPTHNVDRRHYIIGDFFELLTVMIFGGKRRDWEPSARFCPDVTNGMTLMESKAVAWNSELRLQQYQVDRYNEEFRGVNYIIYKYMIARPMSAIGGSAMDVYFEHLSKKVGFCIVMPLTLIKLLVREGNGRYQGFSFECPEPITRISSTFLKLMMVRPGASLHEGFGVRTSVFRYNKRFLPGGLVMCGHEIEPFPILIIKDRKELEAYEL